MMISRFLFILCFSCAFLLQSQTIDTNWLAARYTKQEVRIPVRDGIRLFTAVYAPKDASEKHPILMIRTPYSVAPYGPQRFSPYLISHYSSYVKQNYIIVIQDVRGRYMSEGEFVDVRPFIEHKKTKKDVDEASDAYDTMDWLIRNVSGNNGRIGVCGISYPGFYTTMAALSGHPALKAVSPQAPVTEWFLGDDFHHNGAFALADAFSFYSGFGRPRPQPTTRSAAGFRFPEKDNYNFFLKQGAVRNFTRLLGDSIRFWNELVRHPDYDTFWQERDARRYARNIKPAVLVVGGNFDAEDCYGAYNLYKAIEKQSPATNNKLVMGPWFHGGWHRSDGSHFGNVRFGSKTSHYYREQLETPFFDYHLLGKGSDTAIAEATIFFTGENRWRSFKSWPDAQVSYTPLYFRAGNRLSYTAPAEPQAFSGYTSDPARPVPYAEGVHMRRTREYMIDDQRFAARRTDVLVFETEILDSDLTLGGPLVADLKVRLSTSDADFVVKLIDVFPNDFSYDSSVCCKGVKQEAEMAGYQMLVRGEIMRGRYRNSFEKPEAFEPGRLETVKFTLPDVSHTFRKGHKLMVQIQSSWFPLFDRNPQQFVNIYTCGDEDFIPSDIRVFHQADAASSILLPILSNRP
jgi:putative CocE/NonD family hydrolase